MIYRTNGFLVADAETDQPLPDEFQILGIYPNPFNNSAKIRFTIQQSQHVEIALFDTNGRLIRNLARGKFNAGVHNLKIVGDDLSAGIYLVKASSGGTELFVKAMLLK